MLRWNKNGRSIVDLQKPRRVTSRRKVQVETLETRCLLASDMAGDLVLPGDMNFDHRVDFDDVEPFVLGLNSPEAYEAQYGHPPVLAGDLNGDDRFDFDDIGPFQELLGGGRIHGIKWLDRNGNGERDPGEPGLPGVTIYADVNRNGQLDPREPFTVTMEDNPDTLRDEAGRYWLGALRPGIYVIREIVPDGFEQTFPPSPFADPASPLPFPGEGYHVVKVEPGASVRGIDFGNRPIDLEPASVHGIKWLDRNGNGERENDEPGLPGVVIYSDLNGNRRLDRGEPHTRTMRDDPETDFDEAGLYWLEGLRPGWHLIREVVPDGFQQTFPPLGPVPAFVEPGDPPFAGDGAYGVFLESGEAVEGLDFGNQPARPASVHGAKWLDANGNAEWDPDELGLPGVVIYSDLNFNGMLDEGEPHTVTMEDDQTTAIDESGMYWLEGLRPGEHLIREVVPDGFVQTFPLSPIILAAGDTPAGPAIFPPPLGDAGHYVVLESGDEIKGLDFGNQPAEPASVHGTKWLDANGNAERDPDEPGLPGVVIFSELKFNGLLDDGEPHTVTMEDIPETDFDESGMYWLDGLRPGLHAIREVVPDGFEQTYPVPLPDPVPLPEPIPLGRPDILPGGAHFVFLESGGAVEGIDFGNRPIDIEPASVHGIKWLDRNGNGEQDGDEPGLPGVVIYSDLNGNGQLDRGEPHTRSMRDDPETDFDESGLYWLDGLRPGMHAIREVVPDGFEQTFPPVGPVPLEADEPVIFPFPGDGAHFVFLRAGQSLDGLDFGNRPIRPASVHGTKWLDANGNGEREADEPGLPGVVIYSDLNFNGTLDDDEPLTVTMEDDPTTDFDESGMYWLEGLRPGGHLIREVVPDGFQQTFPPPLDVLLEDGLPVDPDVVPPFPGDGGHYVVLESGGAVDGLDFGNRPIDVEPGSVHGIKWLDRNRNAQRDPGEPGLPGVVIYSDLNGNGQLDPGEPATRSMRDDPNTLFDESGLYWLEGLRPGEHTIREIVPDGFEQTFPVFDLPAPLPVPESPLGEGEDPIPPFAEVKPDAIELFLAPGEVAEQEVAISVFPLLLRPIEIDVVASDPDAEFANLSGVQVNGGGGDTSIFEVQFVGREFPQHFELQFVDAEFGDIVGPTIPVWIGAPVPDGAHHVFVPPGGVVDGIDFGNRPIAPSAIHGRKWLDVDGNGERDPGEPGLAGVTIYLDLNGDGHLTPDEPHTMTMGDNPFTRVDESGLYWFEDLLPGRYIVREVVPNGFAQTYPSVDDGGAHRIGLDLGEIADGVNFGNRLVDFDALPAVRAAAASGEAVLEKVWASADDWLT